MLPVEFPALPIELSTCFASVYDTV